VRGFSPLHAIILSVENDYLATAFNRNFFEQGAVLSGFIKVPEPLPEDAYRRLRDSFENQHSGIAKAHRIAILEGGMDFKNNLTDEAWKTNGLGEARVAYSWAESMYKNMFA
jgi:phage portal protein BeeE